MTRFRPVREVGFQTLLVRQEGLKLLAKPDVTRWKSNAQP